MAAAVRSKENDCDFPHFKTPLRTPLRTPIRNGMLSSATLNDLAFYSSNSKHLKFAATASMNDLQMYNDFITTPIRRKKNLFSTPGSAQNRRALGLVTHNNNQMSSGDDLSGLFASKESTTKHDESVILPAPTPKLTCTHPEDDLPHSSHSMPCYADTFDDLIPADERIERMFTNQTDGVNIFTFYGGIGNTIRCQSPLPSRVDLSTLLDMLN